MNLWTRHTKKLLQRVVVLAVLGSSCVRYPPPVSVGDDRSIRFPEFDAQAAVLVGSTDGPYQLDGAMLRALTIAANDFMPPGSEKPHCLFRQESQFYRVIRQGDIIFVEISYNPAACETLLREMDGGARYAISTDGRILRRLVGIEPDGFPREEPHGESIPVPNHLVGASYEEIRAYWLDAGTPDAGVPPADGGVSVPDGGLAGAPRDGGT